ncbi:MAG: FAD-dependent oxidoreductase [Gammaproteobacteria bacterium]
MKCDVLVLGGGAAGLCASVAAARAGADTVLVERHGALGGMAVAALVHSICGLYRLRSEPGAVLAHRGLPGELAARLIRAGAAPGPVRCGRLDVLPHSPPGFAAVADALTGECPTLETRLHTELAACQGSGRIEAVDVYCRGARATIEPDAVVDASGDATLAALAGAGTDQASATRLQRPAFIFALHTVEVVALDADGRVGLAALLAEAAHAGRIEPGVLGAQFRPTGRASEVYCTVDLAGPADFDPTSPVHLTALEQTGRRLAVSLTAFLRAHHPAFARAELAAFPTRVGIRESRRVRGEITITGEAVLRGLDTPDCVAFGTWPMELREKPTGPRWRYPEDDRPTQIPLGALKVALVANLWTAGRCLSCDHEAQAALRVIGTCLATGQAAGLAAAWQATHGVPPNAADVRAQIETILGPEEDRSA